MICIFLVSFAISFALVLAFAGSKSVWMDLFMGVLLCQFSMLKLFDIHGFAEGFSKYDLLAKRSKAYAYLYPWIELILGLLFISMAQAMFAYLFTLIVFSLGAIGVINALLKGLNLNCACLGTSLKVPLSTVTLLEDFFMIIMALLRVLGI
ncbi:MAG: hypothetical protein EBZ47_03640 [Chlamydiae bacterium]|nr:hypothetical protein [Chlamydiota bacterium]